MQHIFLILPSTVVMQLAIGDRSICTGISFNYRWLFCVQQQFPACARDQLSERGPSRGHLWRWSTFFVLLYFAVAANLIVCYSITRVGSVQYGKFLKFTFSFRRIAWSRTPEQFKCSLIVKWNVNKEKSRVGQSQCPLWQSPLFTSSSAVERSEKS